MLGNGQVWGRAYAQVSFFRDMNFADHKKVYGKIE